MEKKVDLSPVSLPNLNEVVYEMLRERILRYDFSPGQRLDLSELETILQISRTPLNSALTRLESEGLVEIYPRRGTFVAPLSSQKLDEAYKIRSAFELYVALCLFKYLTADDFTFFNSIHAELDELVQAGRNDWNSVIYDYLKIDQQLHERFIIRGGTPRMVELFQQMNVHMQVARIISHYQPSDFESMHFEHLQIFAALDERSSERLSAALFNHLESSRLRALRRSQDL